MSCITCSADIEYDVCDTCENIIRNRELVELQDERTLLEAETFAREQLQLGEAWKRVEGYCEGVDFFVNEVVVSFERGQKRIHFYAPRDEFEAWRGNPAWTPQSMLLPS